MSFVSDSAMITMPYVITEAACKDIDFTDTNSITPSTTFPKYNPWNNPEGAIAAGSKESAAEKTSYAPTYSPKTAASTGTSAGDRSWTKNYPAAPQPWSSSLFSLPASFWRDVRNGAICGAIGCVIGILTVKYIEPLIVQRLQQ